MTPNLTNALSCAVFGHNFKRPEQHIKTAHLVCTSCHEKVSVDPKGNFNNQTSPNTEVHQTLRQLFLLHRKIA